MRGLLSGLIRLNTPVLRSTRLNSSVYTSSSGKKEGYSNDQRGSRWNSGAQRCLSNYCNNGRQLRCYSTDRPQLRCYRLTHRRVINIRGQDTSSFLQGLITNDIHLLEEGPHPALYAHMLSVQGRTLFDVIIYRLPESSDEVLLECDGSVLDSVTRHLKTYKIRRKVSLEPRSDLSPWALLAHNWHSTPTGDRTTFTPELKDQNRVVVMAQDPRTHLMGWRVISGTREDPSDFMASCSHGNTEEYHRHRYRLGVPEGVRDLPPGDALPLESNLVFLNGISFSKGCYLGQELTARTHHTGVVRKRLMPVSLSVPAENLQPGGAIQSHTGKPAGKLRSGVGELGLGLVRLNHAKETLTLTNPPDERVTVTATVPGWWPGDVRETFET
ncbi:putative transferase CAF17 homolog, mitochondrial [Trichomycterus rosablanca]|uniref:putative transferase CAF17 homolog, mitochondrial n=1 Tax=Trichomycterus rosablanca TaxID=2290929 RepID=UPI002F360AAA